MTTDAFSLLASQVGEIRLKRDINISDQIIHSHLGGVVGAYYIATSIRELVRVIELCRELSINFLLIGSGSKVAFAPVTPDLLVIKNRSDNLKIFGVKGKVSRAGIGIEEAFVEAESGASLQNLADFTFKQKLTGLEDLKSVMGTVGGSYTTNRTLRDQAYQIKVLNRDGEIEMKQADKVVNGEIILAVIFKLKAAEV